MVTAAVSGVWVTTEVQSQTFVDIAAERMLVQYLQVRQGGSQKLQSSHPKNMHRASDHRMTFEQTGYTISMRLIE